MAYYFYYALFLLNVCRVSAAKLLIVMLVVALVVAQADAFRFRRRFRIRVRRFIRETKRVLGHSSMGKYCLISLCHMFTHMYICTPVRNISVSLHVYSFSKHIS